jgi:hypothetical protein
MTHELRTLAVTEVPFPGAVACGRSAAGFWGVDLAGPDDPVECVLPPDVHHGSVPGVRLVRRVLPPDQIAARRGVRVTSPMRRALDLATIRPLDEAVVALDRFLVPGLAFLSEVREAADVLTGRDCRQVRRVAQLADGLAGSPSCTRVCVATASTSRSPATVGGSTPSRARAGGWSS